jgi:hypothetical protein
MANCLRKYIDVWDGCSEKDASKMYVNDIPGFTLDVANSITTNEQQSALQLIHNKIDFACNRVENEIRNHLNGKAYLTTLIGQATCGIIQDNLKQNAAIANTLQGIQLDLGYSPFASIVVHSVQFFYPNSGTANLYVYNANTGQLLLQIDNINVVGGEVTTHLIDKEFQSSGQPLNLIFLTESQTNYDIQVFSGGCSGCRGSRYAPINAYAYANQVQIATGAQVTVKNLKGSQSTGGIAINYTIKCDNTDFICSLASMLKLTMLYAAGVEIMDEIIMSRRLNSVTTYDRDKAIDLKAMYQERYSANLAGVLDNMIMPKNICFQCNPVIRNKTRIP